MISVIAEYRHSHLMIQVRSSRMKRGRGEGQATISFAPFRSQLRYPASDAHFRLTAIPWTIASFPRLTVSGVIKLSRPNSSPGPYRPQAFSGGPGFWTGKAENGGRLPGLPASLFCVDMIFVSCCWVTKPWAILKAETLPVFCLNDTKERAESLPADVMD